MKIRKISNIATVALFFMMLNVSTIYSYYFRNLSNLFLIIGGLLTFICCLLSKNIKTSKRVIVILGIWFTIVIFCSVLGGLTSSCFNYIAKLFIMYLIINILISEGIEPLLILYNVCKILTIWAFINYIVMDVVQVHFLPVASNFTTSWGYTYNLYLGVFMENTQQIDFLGSIIKRLHVPFSEPGVAQLFFNFTLFYILFMKKQIEKKDLCILGISVISIVMSNSLTGFLVLGVQVLVYCIKYKKVLLITLLSIIILIAGVYLITEKFSSDSYLDRSGDYVYMISNSINHLPFGIGIGNAEELGPRINDATGRYANSSNFCGLLSPLLYFGLFSIFYYIGLYFSVKYFSYDYNFYSKFSLFAIVMITLFTEPLSITSFFAFLELNGLIHKMRYKYNCLRTEV